MISNRNRMHSYESFISQKGMLLNDNVLFTVIAISKLEEMYSMANLGDMDHLTMIPGIELANYRKSHHTKLLEA